MHPSLPRPTARSWLLAGVAAGALASASPALAIISQNGTGGNPAGTGDVNVLLSCENTPSIDFCTKVFNENATHTMTFTGLFLINETVTNNTGVIWTDFHYGLTGTQGIFTGLEGSPAFQSVQVNPTSIDILFANGGLAPGQNFVTQIFISDGETGSTLILSEAPSIGVPEPASLALLGTGLAGLATLRRRRRTAGGQAAAG